MDGDVHAFRAGVDQPGLHFHHVADQQRPVEPHAAGEHRHRVLPAVARGADVGGFVDPLHDDAAVDLAAPVHIRGGGHEPQHHTFGGSGVGIFLSAHGLDDFFADLDPGQRVVALLDFRRRRRFELRHGDGLAVLAHGHEDHHALAAHGGRAALGIARGHHGADVHGGPAGVDDRGFDLHHVAAVDRVREVDVPHVGRDAIGLGPAHGGGIGGLVHPLQHGAGVDRTAVADVRGGCQEAQGDGIGARSRSCCEFTERRRPAPRAGDTIAVRDAITRDALEPVTYDGGRPPAR